MKIVYCVPQLFRPGGIERMVILKANYLAEVYGYDVTIVVADQKEEKPFYRLNEQVRVVDLGLDYDGTLLLPIAKRLIARRRLHQLHKKKLSELLMKLRPDVTISTFTHEASFLPMIADGSKKVLEFHFCRGHKRKMAETFGLPLLQRLAYKIRCWQEENIIIPKYDQFVVLTEEDKIDWEKKVPSVKCISNIQPFETDEQAILESKSVIAVGRLDAQKGFDKLIKLWGKILSIHPDWTLNIFGQGKDELKLNKLIKSSGLNEAVRIHRPSKDIKKEYLKASIFVMTSAYEGLPMTLLEATGLGLPSVCYDFKCGPTDVIVDGENGYLVKNGDSDAFTIALDKLMEDVSLRKAMGNNAKRLSKRYSKEVIMQKWIELFNKITNKI